jgi:hypothetical protein
LPPRLQNLRLSWCYSGEETERSPATVLPWYDALRRHIRGVRRKSKNVLQRFCDRFLKRSLLTVSRSFMNVVKSVLWRMAIILKSNKVNLFESPVLFVFWFHSLNILDTPIIYIWSVQQMLHARSITSIFRSTMQIMKLLITIVFINNQKMHFLTILLLQSTAPTRSDARASSSASFSVPSELL